jgi:hypothetical protein
MLTSRAVVAFCFLAVVRVTSAEHSEIRWTAAKVVGLHLEVIDRNRAEQYWFTKNYVIPSVSSHDIVVNPLWSWKIRSGHLQIYSESHLEDEFALVSVDSKIITVRRHNGVIARYKYNYR